MFKDIEIVNNENGAPTVKVSFSITQQVPCH